MPELDFSQLSGVGAPQDRKNMGSVASIRQGGADDMGADTSFTLGFAGRQISISATVRDVSSDLIVFMHGFGCAKECFAGAFQESSLREYSLCTFDFPGHGTSAALPSGESSLESYADITCSLIAALAPEHVFIVCHSMGGAVGVLAAQSLPNLAFLVNVEGNLIGRDCGLVSRRTADASPEEFVAHEFPSFAAELLGSSRPDLHAWGQWYARCEPRAMHALSRSLVEWSDSDKLLDAFLDIRHRAYVYGERSELDYLFPRLGSTTLRTVQRSGHFPMLDNRTDFYATVANEIVKEHKGHSRQLATPRL